MTGVGCEIGDKMIGADCSKSQRDKESLQKSFSYCSGLVECLVGCSCRLRMTTFSGKVEVGLVRAEGRRAEFLAVKDLLEVSSWPQDEFHQQRL